MESDEVDLAFPGAGREEGVQPVDAHEGAGAGAVGDGGGADFDGEGVHVLDVVGCGGDGVHVRLGGEVGLVEGEGGGGTGGDG